MSSLAIQIRRANEIVFECTCPSGVEVGRQFACINGSFSEPPPFALCNNPEFGMRLVVVPETSNEIPRRLFKVHSDGIRTKVENIHKTHPLNFASTGTHIEPGVSAEFEGSVSIELTNDLLIQIERSDQSADSDSQCYQSLDSIPPKPSEFDDRNVSQTLVQLVGAADPNSLGQLNRETSDYYEQEWSTGEKPAEPFSTQTTEKDSSDVKYPLLEILKKTLAVVREASGSDAFLEAAVRTTCQIVGLDRTILLVRERNDRWRTKAKYRNTNATKTKREISQTILKRVVKTGHTQVYDGMSWQSQGSSLTDMKFALGAPVLNSKGEVIAVLYGDRSGGLGNGRILEVEATFVEILAGAVAAGLARKEEEERRVALAGYFSPRVADMLSQRPELLEPKQAEVSVLFCDIRGFSSITENAEPSFTFEWLQDVLSEVSQCVVDLDGVLVDYVGDQLFANWGAPDAQPDHHDRALTAAHRILRKTLELRKRWNSRLDNPFSLGVGVSTGIAQAGNVGSRQKFKYGVLGNTVNLGSRLQDATKQLGVDCIADGACVVKAGWQSRSRRLARLRVVGIERPVEAYEIPTEITDEWETLKKGYESALRDFENARFAEATSSLGQLLQEFPVDRPCQLLLERAVRGLGQPVEGFDGIYELLSKS